MDFNDARHLSRMSCNEIAEYLNLSLRTIHRYKSTGKAPKAIIEVLRMLGGQCPRLYKKNDFSGWSFGNGFLYSPAGDKFTSGDILASIIERELNHELMLNLKAIKKQSSNRVSNVISFPLIPRNNSDVA